MCGIFGLVDIENNINAKDLKTLALHAKQRGIDASGLIVQSDNNIDIYRADAGIDKLLSKVDINNKIIVLGHSRLVTNGFVDNQPVYRDELILIHNGIVTNCEDLWSEERNRKQMIDSEIITVIFSEAIKNGQSINSAIEKVFQECEGVISAALFSQKLSKLILFSNNGSLYYGNKGSQFGFSSEEWPLVDRNFDYVKQLKGCKVIDINVPPKRIEEHALLKRTRTTLVPAVPEFQKNMPEAKMLQENNPNLKRCTKCILP